MGRRRSRTGFGEKVRRAGTRARVFVIRRRHPATFPVEAGDGVGGVYARSAEQVLADRWADMIESDPAPPDDVPEPLRGLQAGDRITVTEVSERTLRATVRDLVATSSPRRGSAVDSAGRREVYVWACTPEAWVAHQQTKRPVALTNVALESVDLRPGPSRRQ